MDKELTIEKLPERIRKLREEHGFKTQQAFADALRVDRSVVKSWERFKKPVLPRLENLLSMCQLFECDLDYLIGSIEERTHDIKTACELTGLSTVAIERLQNSKTQCSKVASMLIESQYFELFVDRYLVFLSLTQKLKTADEILEIIPLSEQYEFSQDTVKLGTMQSARFFQQEASRIMDTILGEAYSNRWNSINQNK